MGFASIRVSGHGQGILGQAEAEAECLPKRLGSTEPFQSEICVITSLIRGRYGDAVQEPGSPKQHRRNTKKAVTRLRHHVRKRCNSNKNYIFQYLIRIRHTCNTGYTSTHAPPCTPCPMFPPAMTRSLIFSSVLVGQQNLAGPLRYLIRHGAGNPRDCVRGKVHSLVNR